MTKAAKLFKNLFLWILTVFFVIAILVYMPHFCCLFGLIAVLLVIPISKWQSIVRKLIKAKWLKALLVVILFLAMALTAPTNHSSEKDPLDKPDKTEAPVEVVQKQPDLEDEPSVSTTPDIPTESVEPNKEDEPVRLETPEPPETVENNNTPTWKDGLTAELVADIERAFDEIGENPEYIESVEHVDTTETALFYRRDYKVSFDKGSLSEMFSHKTWVHSRFYRITTQEWFDGEPEKDMYPCEYLAAIKFWKDDDTTNINQWAQNGTGKLQEPNTTELPQPETDNIEVAYNISVEELVEEINKDKDVAGQKYNGKWIEITGKITYISESAGMTGYYLYGERGGSGLNITCWVYDSDHTKLSVGDVATFVGALREISTFNNTEIGDCIIK